MTGRGPFPREGREPTFVLVHGAYHGGWCWRGVADRLRAAGHPVFAPTLTGLGERAHLIDSRPTLVTFVEDVAAVLVMEDLVDVVLVGHSFAGAVIPGVADRMPERLRRLVFLDAIVPRPGTAIADSMPPDIIARYAARADATSGGLSLPPPEPAYFDVADPALASWLEGKLTPHPWQTYRDPLHLANPLGNGVPSTYVAASDPYFRATAASRALAGTLPGWEYREIATGHDAMLTAPDALADLLAELARAEAGPTTGPGTA